MSEFKNHSRIPTVFSIFRDRKVVKKREKPVLSLILFLGMTFKVKGIKYDRQSDFGRTLYNCYVWVALLQGRLLVIKFSSCRQARICKCKEMNQPSRQKYAFDSHMKKGGVSRESRQDYNVLYIIILVISVFAMLELKQSCFNVYFRLFNFTLLEKYSSE